jgi:hypothetical protein
MTDGLAVCALQSAADLFGAPRLPDQGLHLLPDGRGQARAPFGCLPGLGQVMGWVWPIATQTTVAPELPTDRGSMHRPPRWQF